MLYLKDTHHDNLLFLDSEFDCGKLVQLAIFHFVKVENCIYKLNSDFNIYIKHNKIGKYCYEITGITPSFLNTYGVEPKQSRELIQLFFNELKGSIMIIGHGIKQDIKVIKEFGIELPDYQSYCTYNAAKRIYGADSKLSLASLANQAGLYTECHDAHYDALALIPVFSMIKEKEGETNG